MLSEHGLLVRVKSQSHMIFPGFLSQSYLSLELGLSNAMLLRFQFQRNE